MRLTLEDLLRMFVCSETVDAVECEGCQQHTDESASAVRTTFVKRLTLGKVTEFCIFQNFNFKVAILLLML